MSSPRLSAFRVVAHSSYDKLAMFLAAFSLVFVGAHAPLVHIHELFPGAAQIGDVLYDFSLACFASYIFYLIVVAFLREKDAFTSRPVIREAVNRIAGDESVVMNVLGQPTSSDIEGAVEPNIADLCQKKDPKTGPERAYLTNTGIKVQKITVWAAIKERVDRSQRSIDRLLRLTPLLDAELVRLLIELESCSIFVQAQDYFEIMATVTNPDMTAWVTEFENYHIIVKQLKAYRGRELN